MSTTSDLPRFKYHPDPLASGSIVPSPNACRSCGRVRGFIYSGPTYTVEELEDSICPWCISEGTAHEKFDASFTDITQVGGSEWIAVSRPVAEEVAFRTPGFSGWQAERWFTHCEDAGEFLGPMGRTELEAIGSEAIAVIRLESSYSDDEWQGYWKSMDRDHGPTAYVFRCRHCGKLGGYSDCH
jgi:hypothetical protein